MTTLARRHPLDVAAAPIALGLGVTLVAALYAGVLRELAIVWRGTSYYTYGPAVPLFSAYLVWEARARLRGPVVWHLPGLIVVALGVAVAALAMTLGSLTLAALSLPFCLGGLALVVLGRERFGAVAFALAFLALMAPLPPAWLGGLSLALQSLAAACASTVLRLASIPVHRDGLSLFLPGAVVEVTEACNGLRFLLTMLVIGVATAALVERRRRHRVAIVALALALALAANQIRVTGTALATHSIGAWAATGTAHLLYGKAVYGAFAGIFVAVVAWLRRGRS